MRDGIYYLKNVEREALVELAFQVNICSYQEDVIIFKQLDKIKEILLVYDGTLKLMLPDTNLNPCFETLTNGSSYGLYSVLRYDEEEIGRSRFKVVS